MQSLALLLHDAARLMKGEFERRTREYRLSLMQWRTLGALARSDGMSQTALATRVEASPMTMSDIIDRLESLGLVRREADPDDGRAKLIWITDQAKPIVKDIREIASQVYEKALAGIDPGDLEILTRSLQRITTNLEAADVTDTLAEKVDLS